MLAKKPKKRKFKQAILFSVILGLLTVSAAGFLIVSNWKISQKRSELTSKLESLKKEIQTLEEKNAQLKAGINQSQSQEYLEEVAREQLDLKKPDEEVVVVKPSENSEIATATEKGFWQKIKEKVGF